MKQNGIRADTVQESERQIQIQKFISLKIGTIDDRLLIGLKLMLYNNSLLTRLRIQLCIHLNHYTPEIDRIKSFLCYDFLGLQFLISLGTLDPSLL